MVPRLAVAIAVLLAAAGCATAGKAAAQPLTTAIVDPYELDSSLYSRLPLEYRAIRGAGARELRMVAKWERIAPARPSHPASPGDPAYDFSKLDARIDLAVHDGLRPLLSTYGAPAWALDGGRNRPRVSALKSFMRALATRYDGRHGHPRVRDWQVWNEPNLNGYLDQAGAPAYYRSMVNASAAAVKSVRRSNLVVAGGLAPFGGVGTYGSRSGSYGTRPMPFMRELLRKPVRFDVWAHHPYTSGGPTRHALQPGDVSIGDLGQMRSVLISAWRSGQVRSPARPRFWVTEFSWDTNPPDGGGVPLKLHARWVSEALYRMWRDGVSLVTWFQLRDEPLSPTPIGIWQSGLYFTDGQPKPALQAFRFPFVAFRSRGRVSVWGRTPQSNRKRVVVEQHVRGRWRRLKTLQSDRNGIFEARVRPRSGDPLRARVAGSSSRAFSLVRPKDRFVNPFGTGAAPE